METAAPVALSSLHTKYALYELNGNGQNTGIASCPALLFPFTQPTVKHIYLQQQQM